MTTLYQIHSSMDQLEASIDQMARSFCAGDCLLLLGTTAAYIDWLQACLSSRDLSADSIYAQRSDVDALNSRAQTLIREHDALTLLDDSDWVDLTLGRIAPFISRTITIAL